MKVILIRSRATDQAIYKYCREIANLGYTVTLLIWDRKHILNDEKIKNLNYNTVRFTLKAPQDNFWSILFLPVWWIYIIIFLLRNHYDIVHFCDLDTMISSFFIKKNSKVKIIYSIFDFYADNIPEGVCDFIRKYVRKLINELERYFIQYSDLLILVDESRMPRVEGCKIKKVIFIYNTPVDYFKGKFYQIQNNSKKFIIFYAGIIIRIRGIQYMIQAVEELDDVELILGGNVVEPDIFPADFQKSNKIKYIGWIPTYEEIIEKTLNSDLLFRFSDPEDPCTTCESPNKLFEAMMCGKPIIVTDQSAMTTIVKKERCGIVVPYGDVAALKTAIMSLKNNHELYQQICSNGRTAYEKRYSWDIMKTRLKEGYDSLKNL